MALYCAETWTPRAADQKYLESFEMWCWRRIEKISWTDHVRNEEVLFRDNEQRNILDEIRKRKANWVDHILRRNCLLKQVIEGKIKGEIEVKRRRGRKSKNLLDDLKDRRWYCHLKEEAVDRTLWRNRFGGGFGPVVRQNTEWMNSVYSDYSSVQIVARIHTGFREVRFRFSATEEYSSLLPSIYIVLGLIHPLILWIKRAYSQNFTGQCVKLSAKVLTAVVNNACNYAWTFSFWHNICSSSCKWLLVLPCAVINECRYNSYVYHLVYQNFNIFTIYKENEKETFKVGLMTCFVSRNFLQRWWQLISEDRSCCRSVILLTRVFDFETSLQTLCDFLFWSDISR